MVLVVFNVSAETKMAVTLRGFLELSPPRRGDSNKENDVPVLSLIQFSKAPFVTFGSVKLNTSKSAFLRVENPTVDAEAEVVIEKIPSFKGFSVDHTRFTIKPESYFTLTITWTPAEEGGIREIIIFNANGILKHQAVLLGRTEASKTKKKTLWDSIKKNRVGRPPAVIRGKKTEPSMKISSHKTFQVSRKPKYNREKPRSPLVSLNEDHAGRERSLSKCSPIKDRQGQQRACEPPERTMSLALSNVACPEDFRRNSPLVLLVPAAKLREPDDMSACPLGLMGTPECMELTRVLNRTLSPVGTPDSLKRLMPRIQMPESLPAGFLSAAADHSSRVLTGATELSVKDALALIDSDLHQVNYSPPEACSSYDFSDSLESVAGNLCYGPDKPDHDSPGQPPAGKETRCTFFVSKKPVTSQVIATRADNVGKEVKKLSFTSATVTKSKAPVAGMPVEVGSSGGRRTRKSRRRLMEKTLELSNRCSPNVSVPGTPDLPVIDSGGRMDIWRNSQATSSLCDTMLPHWQTVSLGLSPAGSGPPVPDVFPVASPLSPVHFLPLATFPVHTEDKSDMAARGKKRKSDEYLRSKVKVEEAEKTDRVKRRRAAAGVARETLKSACEKRTSVSERRQPRPAGSVCAMSSLSAKATRRVARAQAKQPSSKPQGAQSLKSVGGQPVRMAKVIGVARGKLTFIKPAQTAIPRHPMPFAAKNMFYDERWIEKQERGFTWWINYVLTPDDFKVNTKVAKVNAVSLAMSSDAKFSVPKAPTKEEMSFSMYTARRRLNRLRRSACQLFASEAVVRAIRRLELEVEAKRLLVRKDRHLWKDIGERQKVLNWLLSYNPLWLRIGLETIYGELIPLESNSDILGLAMFILGRMLWNPDIAAEFRHANVPHLYKDGHEEALSRFTLKKLLLLVCFLDRAKGSRLIQHDPCLFCMDAEFKTSKDLLLAFSRDFLSGEGILPRHLGYLGLPVSHAQTPLDEFDFSVKNLALDLKCGIRLVRVMELFIQDWRMSRKLRIPAISRLQKIHNVDIALQVLNTKGVDLGDEHGSVISSRDIVDGHREKTLSLLWKIIFAFQVEVILNEDELIKEVGFLKRTLSTKQKLASLRANRGPEPRTARATVPFQHSSTKITLLMEWVNAVCDYHNLRVENFTVSFSDGRILSYLIHHYHPNCLPVEAISRCTTQTVDCSHRGRVELDCSASDSDTSFDSLLTARSGPESPNMEFKELLENEKNNFKLINGATAFLGGVPAMINPADMSNTIPNEKVVISYLSFLCARLLDLRNETRAARVIQDAWRKYKLKNDLELYQEKNVAAAKIQVLVRSFLQRRQTERRNWAAVIIQARWKGYAARNALRRKRETQLRAVRQTAATVIQAQWRMYFAKRTYQSLRYHAIVIQAQWRMCRAVHVRRNVIKMHRAATIIQANYKRSKQQSAFRRKRWAALVVQQRFRAQRQKSLELKNYQQLKNSVIRLQSACRGMKSRQKVRRMHQAAFAIQRAYRAHRERRQYLTLKSSTTVIQRRYRAMLAAKQQVQLFQQMRRAAILLQAAYRGHQVRMEVSQRHQAATLIQAVFRKHRGEVKFRAMRMSAITIQRYYRASVLQRRDRENFLKLKQSAIVLQATFRGYCVRRNIVKLHRAATIIQANYKRSKQQSAFRRKRWAALVVQQRFRAQRQKSLALKNYQQLKNSVIRLQSACRGMKSRQKVRRMHQAAFAIQRAYRAHRERRQYLTLKSSTTVIQRRYRAMLAAKQQVQLYQQMRRAAILLQAAYRGHQVRMEVSQRHQAATLIQAVFRKHRGEVKFRAMRMSAITIQRYYRASVLQRRDRENFLKLKQSAIVLQAAFRGHCVRRNIVKLHRAATIIQANYKRSKQQSAFRRKRWAALVVQQRFRAQRQKSLALKNYQQLKNSVIRLQSACRGMKSRQKVRRMHQAAFAIQRAYRAHRERRQYLTLKSSTTVIQRRYRAMLAAKQQVQLFQQMRRAAIMLQAAYRGHQVRMEVSQRHQAATLIQAVFRKHRGEVKFRAMRMSAITIQRYYRASVLQRRDRENFLKLKQSAIVLQAAFRGHCVRRNIVKLHRAATIIQANYKRSKQQSAFRRKRWAALVVQQRFRAQRQKSLALKNYQQLKNSVIRLQSACRGMKSRQKVRRMHQAAFAIQRAYRAHRERRQYLTLKSSTTVIQRRYRAMLAAKQQVQLFQQMRMAAILLQAAYRGHQVRMEVSQRHQAATLIQAVFRKHRGEVKFRAMRMSAITIQRYYRASVLQRRDRENFLKLKQSAIVLQAAFRGYCVRRNIVKLHRAATIIQANYKRSKQQSAFRRKRWAALVVQQRFRAQRQKSLALKNYQQLKNSVIRLQSACRGMKSRQKVRRMHQAAFAIQRAYRAHRERRQYLTLKSSTTVIQRRYRAMLAAKQQVQLYQQMRRAAILLQAAYRGHQVRMEVSQRHQAATLIQAVFRKHRGEVKFRAMRMSAITIQRYYRASVLQRRDRENFLKLKQSAIVLQAAFRGHCVRRNIVKLHRAATIIQANYKRSKQQSAFRRKRWAALVVQQRFRAQRQKSLALKNYQQLKNSVIRLQSACRGMKSRQKVRRMHQAAFAIQRAYRAHRERRQYLTLKSSTTVIQRRYRAMLAAKQQVQLFQQMRRAAIMLQAAYRGHQVRMEVSQRHQAATLIQAVFRKHRGEVKFRAMRMSAITIQRYYRASVLQRRDRENFLKLKQSAIVLQAAFRGHCVRRNIVKLHRAATIIQANYKRSKQQSAFRRKRWAALVVQQRFRAQRQKSLALKNYQQLKNSVIRLQSACRGMKSRQKVRRMHQAAFAIQRAYRAHRERRQYLTLKSSTTVIQRRYRAMLAAKQQVQLFQQMRRAAILLQAAYRGHQVRMEVSQRHQAATVIQAVFRKHRGEVKFRAMRMSAITIQRYYRASVLQRRDRENFLKLKQSAIVFQATFRGWRVRRVVGQQNEAATQVQSFWPSSIQGHAFLKKIEAVIILQRRVRAARLAKAEKHHYTCMREAAITLQAYCRGWIVRKQALQATEVRRLRFTAAVFHNLCAIRIQRALRSYWALQSAKRQIHCVMTIQRWVRVRQQRKSYLEERKKVVLAQRAVRHWLVRRHQAASIIQHAAKRFVLLRRQLRIQQGIIKAQALWRGHRSRMLRDHTKLVEVRHRLRKASTDVQEEDKLCNKTSLALDYLLHYKHFSYILEALKNLEAATRLSPECCERLVDSGATLVIFTLIRCCNRSVPCMDVITFSIQILLNLSKYHKTIEAVYAVENSVATLLDLLQRYREKAGDKVADKGGSIFTKACFLLALLLQDHHRAMEARRLPKALDRISSIYRLTARKHKLDAARTVVKQKMSASVNGSFLLQATTQKSRPPPKFAPDWVLRKDKLKDIVDPLRAIQMVADTFSIVL